MKSDFNFYRWKMAGEFKDGYETEVCGIDEEECMSILVDMADAHGDLVWYSGANDEDYVDGEYIGRDNFI